MISTGAKLIIPLVLEYATYSKEKEIDDILDLIYDNPITKKPTDNENNYGIDPITSTPNVNPEEINIKDMYQETIEKESKLFNSRVSECRDIDDVLDILNSIKIR